MFHVFFNFIFWVVKMGVKREKSRKVEIKEIIIFT